jgi:hypothetical protein
MEVPLALTHGDYLGRGRKADALSSASDDLPPLLEGRRKVMDQGGRTRASRGCVRPSVNETKLAVVAVMHAFGRPVTAPEPYRVWGECKGPAILDYHLRSLMEMGVVEVVCGPELHFGLAKGIDRAELSIEAMVRPVPRAESRGEGMAKGIPGVNKRLGRTLS